MNGYTICPICGKVAYHSSHFKAFTCGGCGWFKYADEAKPTNADRIRAMSDVAMATQIATMQKKVAACFTGRYTSPTREDIAEVLKWLQQPAEEG